MGADEMAGRAVENVKMRSHVQATRYWVFALIDVLMAHHRDGTFSLFRPDWRAVVADGCAQR